VCAAGWVIGEAEYGVGYGGLFAGKRLRGPGQTCLHCERNRGDKIVDARHKVTAPDIQRTKQLGRKVCAVTAYDATFARLLDEAGVDILLVGDSLGMVVQGQPNTLTVTVEDMIYHTRAVVRGATRAQVVADLPFMSYQISPEQALLTAARLVREGGAEAVKLEGGSHVAKAIERIVACGIPVMGHVGLTPQSVLGMGGFRVQGKEDEALRVLLDDIAAVAAAGAYAVVVEGVPSDVGAQLTAAVQIPTIGIGAGASCDGQVLVCYDMLGLFREFKPKFVKRFAELGENVVEAARTYVKQVQSGEFPGLEHSFAPRKPVEPEIEATGSGPMLVTRKVYGPADES
jgi:3-methyl-2-oxobutanoate hydroxymethyltransferase